MKTFAGLDLFLPALLPGVSEEISRKPCAPPLQPDICRLTAGLARREEPAYRQFDELYFNRLLRYLLVLTGGREDAAREALQATMLRLVRHARRFESEPVFWSWLTVLARSSLVDAERKRKRQLALLERFFRSSPPPDPADHSEPGGKLMSLLEQKLGELPPLDRRLVESKYFESGSVREIAREIGVTEKAVESRLVRIRRHLKAIILAELKNEP